MPAFCQVLGCVGTSNLRHSTWENSERMYIRGGQPPLDSDDDDEPAWLVELGPFQFARRPAAPLEQFRVGQHVLRDIFYIPNWVTANEEVRIKPK